MKQIYLLPVAIASWHLGKGPGLAIAAFCTRLMLQADLDAKSGTNVVRFLPYWNASVRFAFSLIVNTLLVALRQAYNRERRLARTDGLTRLLNSRYFSEPLTEQLQRSCRSQQPLAIAYFDLDNFKLANDRYGHSAGDHLLPAIAAELRQNLRCGDAAARLGGDELALWLSDITADQALPRLQQLHTQLQAMAQRSVPELGISIGIAGFPEVPPSADEAIACADRLMYCVKQQGKNAILCRVVESSTSLLSCKAAASEVPSHPIRVRKT